MAYVLRSLWAQPFRKELPRVLRGGRVSGDLGTRAEHGDSGRTRVSQAPPPFSFTSLAANWEPEWSLWTRLGQWVVNLEGQKRRVIDPWGNWRKSLLLKRSHIFFFSFRIIYRVPDPLTLILGIQVKNRGGGVRPRAVSCDGPSPFTASPLRTLLLVLGNRQFRLWVHVDCLPALLYFCVCFLDPGRQRDLGALTSLSFHATYL